MRGHPRRVRVAEDGHQQVHQQHGGEEDVQHQQAVEQRHRGSPTTGVGTQAGSPIPTYPAKHAETGNCDRSPDKSASAGNPDNGPYGQHLRQYWDPDGLPGRTGSPLIISDTKCDCDLAGEVSSGNGVGEVEKRIGGGSWK